MKQILEHLRHAQAAATTATLNAETAYNRGAANHITEADLAKLAPGRHRLLLKEINQAIDRAQTIAATEKL